MNFPPSESSAYFNPRSREGSDGRDHRKSGQHKHFNPRSREGSDFCFCHVLYLHFLFQSTLPRGERLRAMMKYSVFLRDFNPRSREGSDCQCRGIVNQSSKFQSTLPRGERRSGERGLSPLRIISIHAPARGATSKKRKKNAFSEFQSTLPRGERLQFYLKFTLCF